MRAPLIIVSSGEPAGIGPDIVLQSAHREFAARLAVVGDIDLLRQRANALGLTPQLHAVIEPAQIADHRPGHLQVMHIPTPQAVRAGTLNAANSAYVLTCLEAAAGCLGRRDPRAALVTAPVHKGIINEAGCAFSGHTEWLAQRAEASRAVMMLVNRTTRVALATTHLPLAEVPHHITRTNLHAVLSIIHHDLHHRFGLAEPIIGVCGLNPHAGESGHLGREEIDIIAPVIRELRARGLKVTGPLAADTAFTAAHWSQFDVLVAMYHDQGLPAIKQQGFGEIVNVTLGLPFIRTSVDHGVALDLAARGTARESSLIAAIELAIELATRRSE